MMFTYLDKDRLLGNCKLIPVSALDIEHMHKEIATIPDELWNSRFRAEIHQDTSSVFLKGFPPIEKVPEDDDQAILSSLPFIREFIYTRLPGTPRKCLVAKLRPNGVIKLHEDGTRVRDDESALVYDYFKSTIRIHIPIVSNDKVYFFINNQFYTMPVGQVWAINNLCAHGVINNDPEMIRIHIIVDVIPNTEQQQQLQNFNEPAGWLNESAFRRLIN